MSAPPQVEAPTPIDFFLAEQSSLTAVERFAAFHEADLTPAHVPYYRDLIPFQQPLPGQQYAFAVDLDTCTGCKACVSACHSLNGLDADESWRSVGTLVGTTPTAPVQMTVTTACHHCVDPACLSGCPVDAYEKDPITGIVSHLDDQCIGCGYCTLTCPYEVPVFNADRGIVRKCDMCRDRLAADEAPACVQACPNQAITITIVDTDTAGADGPLVPGAPSSTLTRPTTTYTTTKPEAASMRAADHYLSRPAHGHTPLAVVLVLTQMSVGALIADVALRAAGGPAASPLLPVVALAVGLLGLAASVAHLGRPRYAFRAIIGIRHSWLSREILAFGGYAATATLYAALRVLLPGSEWVSAAGLLAAGTGVAGITCSVMIYAVTHRRWWRARATGLRFGLTTALSGLAALLIAVPAVAHDVAMAVVVVATIKLAWEGSVLLHLRADTDTDLRRTALLLTRDLVVPARTRLALGLLGGMTLPLLAAAVHPAWAVAGLAAIAAGELLERSLFFRAVTAPRMPGALP